MVYLVRCRSCGKKRHDHEIETDGICCHCIDTAAVQNYEDVLADVKSGLIPRDAPGWINIRSALERRVKDRWIIKTQKYIYSWDRQGNTVRRHQSVTYHPKRKRRPEPDIPVEVPILDFPRGLKCNRAVFANTLGIAE